MRQAAARGVVPPVQTTPPPTRFKGDCAADVRRLLVHTLARGLYFHNSMQCRGTGIGVASPPDPLPPRVPLLTPSLAPSLRRRLPL